MKIGPYEITFNIRGSKPETVVEETTNVKIETPKTQTTAPAGRVSVRDDKTNVLRDLKTGLNFLTPDFELEVIPVIRKLYKYNPDLGLVLFDLIQLTNTGHTIKFDESTPAEYKAKMIAHLETKRKTWGVGVAGIDGLVNKMIAQIYVGGALSNEWVVDLNLKGIDYLAFVNPETIRFAAKGNKVKYEPYQKVANYSIGDKDLIKLNQATYIYMGLISDTDAPHGVPPFLTALDSISTQVNMKKNINFIMKQMGLMGFLEALLDKPDQAAGESEAAYLARITQLLTTTKQNIADGMIDGVMVGYKEDHEFQFHSTTKNMTGVADIFNQNEGQVANGLKTTPAFMGMKGIGTEGSTGIVFTKMLSQLKNVQSIVKMNLEHGYGLELQLAGFTFKGLKVEFNASTITDDMKIQQGKEVKVRNLRTLYADGIISQETYSEEMGYGLPDQKEPRVEIDPNKVQGDYVKKKERESDKDKSDRKGRDKSKPQPKRKDTNTKPQ